MERMLRPLWTTPGLPARYSELAAQGLCLICYCECLFTAYGSRAHFAVRKMRYKVSLLLLGKGHMRFGAISQVALLALLGAGCSALPVDGPDHQAIDAAATESVRQDANKVVVNYVLVDLSRKVLDLVERIGPESFFRTFGTGKGAAPEISLGAGDTLSIAIFESSAGGLFTPGEVGARPGRRCPRGRWARLKRIQPCWVVPPVDGCAAAKVWPAMTSRWISLVPS